MKNQHQKTRKFFIIWPHDPNINGHENQHKQYISMLQ